MNNIVEHYKQELAGSFVALIEATRRIKHESFPPEEEMIRQARVQAAVTTNSCVECLSSLKDRVRRTVSFDGEEGHMCNPCYTELYPTPDHLPKMPPLRMRRVARKV